MTCNPKKVHVVFVLHKQEKESINRSTDDAAEENFLKSTCTKRWKDQASFRFASDMLNQTLRSTSCLPGTVRTIKRKGWSWGLTLTLETKPGTRTRNLEIRSLTRCHCARSAAKLQLKVLKSAIQSFNFVDKNIFGGGVFHSAQFYAQKLRDARVTWTNILLDVYFSRTAHEFRTRVLPIQTLDSIFVRFIPTNVHRIQKLRN